MTRILNIKKRIKRKKASKNMDIEFQKMWDITLAKVGKEVKIAHIIPLANIPKNISLRLRKEYILWTKRVGFEFINGFPHKKVR